MGYRSNWQLAVVATDQNSLDRFLHWMLDYSTGIYPQMPTTQEHRDIMGEILKCEKEKTDTYVVFGDDYTKCYTPWDDVIDHIKLAADNNPEWDMGYVRLGEDMDDNETIYGDKAGVTPNIIRDIDGFDITSPTKATPTVAAVATALSTVAPKQEEQCKRCGKMKDVGQKCWWCGQ